LGGHAERVDRLGIGSDQQSDRTTIAENNYFPGPPHPIKDPGSVLSEFPDVCKLHGVT